MPAAEDASVLRLVPGEGERVPLQGLYLSEPFGPPAGRSKSFVYTNFLASLDGRISLPDPQTGKITVPAAIANERDWRLFQELAAGADAVITSGRYVRDLPRGVSARSFPVSSKPEFTDLLDWRLSQGLTPQPAVVIVSASLDLPDLSALAESGRTAYVATGEAADQRKIARIESQAVRVLRVGDGTRVEGRRLIEALAREGHWNVAMISGGELLNALIVDNALDRLYLTQACSVLGGPSFDTLLTGAILDPPAHFRLKALHYDAAESGVEQLFAILDRGESSAASDGKEAPR